MTTAGRSCPLHYRYRPEVLNRPAELAAETLYVIGGLYGNTEALLALQDLVRREPQDGLRLVFNGDFNWFDVAPAEFERINQAVLQHTALQGNVEAELGAPSGAGCGCAYPDSVSAEVVDRSNRIMTALQDTAAGFPDLQRQLSALPMHLVAAVGGLRVAIVHGDTESLSGWRFDQAQLPAPTDADGQARLAEDFRRTGADLIACTHTCLPCAQDLLVDDRPRALINNGSAGMPNFAGDPRGLVTRVSLHAAPVPTLYGMRLAGVYIDAVPLAFDTHAWQRRFLQQWPPGTPAYASYYERITRGPSYAYATAARGAFRSRHAA
jgi:hypothetical protein